MGADEHGDQRDAGREAIEPWTLERRRALMKLRLEERGRLLAEQGEAAASYYEQDTEWRELHGGDIYEY